ncbi:hypothetical protein F5144DRAFT_149880 [Chaetomium tenue]|uniref:Uncharacterized protein n=1 Tax=Chaetomium tenue TaxID=1854479 RepID=A0ACB7PLH8_9PEZI|nr:hypothetical protein F5144DRAFT_149880 [Chaetomium globosum]
MIPGVESRLAIVAVFFILQIFVFALELLIFVPSVNDKRWYIPLRQWIAPASFAFLGTVLVPITFTNPTTQIERTGSQCTTGIDADVAGMGVRIAVWVQVSVLILITLMGNFHLKATGAKEMGAGLVLTHVSLAIALLVQLRRATLSPPDAAAGAMILDAQNMALSIQLAAKETLAARWQVGIVVLTQVFGLSIVPVLVSNFFEGSFATEECGCLTVFWWAWLSNCLPSSRERAVFWVYYASRCVGFCQAAFHAIYNTETFHEAEPKGRGDSDDEQEKGGLLVGITYPYIADGQSGRGGSGGYDLARYGEYPATVSFMYGWYGVYALTSLAAAEVAMRDLNLQPTSAIDSVGQIIALVIAGATTLRAVWLFGKLFADQWNSQKSFGFMWPFHLPLSAFRGRPTYLLVPNFDLAPDSVKLGSILKRPEDVDDPINDTPIPAPPGAVSTMHVSVPSDSFPRTAKSKAPRFLSALLGSRSPSLSRRMTVDSLKVENLLVEENYLKESLKQEKVAQYLASLGKKEKRARKVFMVVGVIYASGVTVSFETEPLIPPAGPVLVSAGASKTVAHRSESDMVVAYRLKAITLDKKLEVKHSESYTKGALL